MKSLYLAGVEADEEATPPNRADKEGYPIL